MMIAGNQNEIAHEMIPNNRNQKQNSNNNNNNKLCAWRHNIPRPSPPPVARRRADAT